MNHFVNTQMKTYVHIPRRQQGTCSNDTTHICSLTHTQTPALFHICTHMLIQRHASLCTLTHTHALPLSHLQGFQSVGRGWCVCCWWWWGCFNQENSPPGVSCKQHWKLLLSALHTMNHRDSRRLKASTRCQ